MAFKGSLQDITIALALNNSRTHMNIGKADKSFCQRPITK